MDELTSYLCLDWANKPENVRACTTLVKGGSSTGVYAEYNLATHVGDNHTAVQANREKLIKDLGLSAEPVWLQQVHSDEVIDADESALLSSEHESVPKADASVSRSKGVVCAVLTADCLPVFICNQAGTEVAVVHAGWRGLHAGIISRTISKMRSATQELLVYFGPAIGPRSFEVGDEVLRAFVDKNKSNNTAFQDSENGLYLCDIYELARIELQLLGVAREQITGGGYCTFSEAGRFYSYRRQNNTGRMANLIWIT